MELLNYLLKVSACLALFFAFYLLFLRKLTFFKFNRFYLLSTLLLSIIIPSLQFTIEREVAQVSIIESPKAIQNQDLGGQAFQTSIQVGAAPLDVEYQPFDWYALLPYAYMAIVAGLLLLTFWRIYQLLKYTNRTAKKVNGLKIVEKTKGFTNCSFFNYVFVDQEKLTDAEFNVLLRHEEVHAKQLHSIDKIVMMVAKALLWFNPIIYLYDKALEQTHEYEADETTSTDFGANNYASLLLRLAVEKGQMPLVHNFVKSPIKARIKMLFNAKSKNMKKLIYLLVLPVGMLLIWSFTIDVVYALPQQNQEVVKQDTSKTTKRALNFAKFEAYRKSPEFLKRLKEAEAINGQTLKGVIGSDYKEDKSTLNNGKLFIVGDKTYILQAQQNMDKLQMLKANDDIEVKVATALISQNVNYLIISAQTIKKGDILVYAKPPLKKQPFLYEANRARFAQSKIKSIEKNASGIISKIVLNDKTFTIRLNLAAQKIRSTDFKIGDDVLVKFFGEKLTGDKTYSTDKMIVLYSQPKKYEIRNPSVYSRFYHEDGSQIVPEEMASTNPIGNSEKAMTAVQAPQTKLLYSSSLTADTKSNIFYIKKGKMEIGAITLEADDMVWDKNAETISAEKGTIKNKKGDVITGESLLYNLKANTYQILKTSGSVHQAKSSVYELLSKLPYSAADSVKKSKTENTVTLYGKASINLDGKVLKGDKIEIDKNSNMITAYNAELTGLDQETIKAKVISYNATTKKGVIKDIQSEQKKHWDRSF
jgi:lipopolysaccharide export system protein LptA